MSFDPDFDLPWCQDLLNSKIEILEIPYSHATKDALKSGPWPPGVSNSMFVQTLYSPIGIRAHINFKRPTNEPDAIHGHEYCYLLSLGTGLDGKSGRAHGGFNALMVDHMTGSVSARASESIAPATATMTVDYKAPIVTPGVILCRGWAIEKSGRKTWARAVLEDSSGKVLASGKALFIDPKESKM